MFNKREPPSVGDPYTPVKTRRTSIATPNAQSSRFLQPPEPHGRNRAVSLPAAPAAVGSPNRTPQTSRLPQPKRFQPSPSPEPPSVSSLHKLSPNPRPAPRVPKPSAQSPRRFVKPEPRLLLRSLGSILGPEKSRIQEYLETDDLLALHEREWMERQERESTMSSKGKGALCAAFGAPLRQVSAYASTNALLGGYDHALPIVVFACVEELYRTGNFAAFLTVNHSFLFFLSVYQGSKTMLSYPQLHQRRRTFSKSLTARPTTESMSLFTKNQRTTSTRCSQPSSLLSRNLS